MPTKLHKLFLPLAFIAVIFSGCSYYDGYKYCKANPETCYEPSKVQAKEKAAIVSEKIKEVSQPVIETAINSSGVPGAGIASKPLSTVAAVLLGAIGGSVATPALTFWYASVNGRKKKKEDEEADPENNKKVQ